MDDVSNIAENDRLPPEIQAIVVDTIRRWPMKVDRAGFVVQLERLARRVYDAATVAKETT